MSDDRKHAEGATPAWLAGGGEAGHLVRTIDWSATPLGPPSTWPASLQTTVGTLLHSRHPMFLWWGPELIQIYNDAYVPSFGRGKHPSAMGQRGAECWKEIWPIIGPQIDDVMTRAKASWNEDHLVPVWRNGRIEEVYWTYGYSPVFGAADEVCGTLVVCTEVTARVIGERRARVLRELAVRVANADDVLGVESAVESLVTASPHDVTFALFYLVDPASGALSLERAGDLDPKQRAVVESALRRQGTIDSPWEVDFLVDARGVPLPGGPWPEPTTAAFAAPLTGDGDAPIGLVVFGLSPRLPFDDVYRDHLLQLAQHASLALRRIEANQAKDQLRQRADLERRRLFSLFEQAPVAIAVLRGPSLVFELTNPGYHSIVHREDIVGKPLVDAVPELAGQPIVEVLRRVGTTGERYVGREFPVKLVRRTAEAAEDHFFDFVYEPFRDEEGRIDGVIAIALDVTDRVHAAHDRERLVAEREALFAERETLLARERAARQEAESASRSKDEFLAMLGHELRNPLAPISTALQLLRLRGDARGERERTLIERQVRHLTSLIDDLLDVSRITGRKVSLKCRTIELGEIVARGVELASPLLEERSHRLDVQVPLTGLSVFADPTRLAQVVSNLLTNAAKYTATGGHVTVRAARQGDRITLTVEDDGTGISPEMLPLVFDLFAQERQALDRAQGGLGLGLTIVRSIVEMHGGTVAATSPGRGMGSTFTIELLAAELAAPVESGAATSAGDRLDDGAAESQPRVLIVDDNSDAAELLGDVVSALGCRACVRHDGPSALDAVKTFTPEIALLDIGLPVMNGYELAKELRQTLGDRRPYLVAVTGYGQRDDVERARAAGFDHHLVKPVSLDELETVIRNAVRA